MLSSFSLMYFLSSPVYRELEIYPENIIMDVHMIRMDKLVSTDTAYCRLWCCWLSRERVGKPLHFLKCYIVFELQAQ